jgi:hypothetical protein
MQLLLTEFYNTCKSCLILNRPGMEIYIAYALFVLISGFLPFYRVVERQEEKFAGKLPIGELPKLPRPRRRIQEPVDVILMRGILNLVSFDRFRDIVQNILNAMRTFFLLRDNPSFLRSFIRFFNLYYVIIVLPAAFMPPVAGQRRADFHLLAAVILLIFINALGDAISFRYVLNDFPPTLTKFRSVKTPSKINSRARLWRSVKVELSYYLTVAKGVTIPLAVLVLILALSSVLYGVQIGQFNFELSIGFLQNAWERMLRFPELVAELYWFVDRPGPFGWAGIPGLFIYGIISFTPVIVLGLLALFWLLLMPLRIAVNFPGPLWARVILSESAVYVVCLIISSLFKIKLF